MVTTARILPGADVEFDEFVKPDDNGDSANLKAVNGGCGEFAEVSAVHIVTGLTLTPDNFLSIVARDVAHGWASDDGAEPLVSIAHDLDTLKLLYTLYNFPGPSDWLSILQDNAGIQPVILELANGQNLSGDEPGLHYHFVCVVGIDASGNFLCCDGDNVKRDAEHLVAAYTPTMIEGARPCGMIVVKYPQQDPYGYVIQADGSVIYNASSIHLIGDVAEYVKTHNVHEECLYPETYIDDGKTSVTPFTNNFIIVYSAPDKALSFNQGGEIIARILGAQASSKKKSTGNAQSS